MSWCCSARIHIILTIVGPCVCPHALIHARRPHSRSRTHTGPPSVYIHPCSCSDSPTWYRPSFMLPDISPYSHSPVPIHVRQHSCALAGPRLCLYHMQVSVEFNSLSCLPLCYTSFYTSRLLVYNIYNNHDLACIEMWDEREGTDERSVEAWQFNLKLEVTKFPQVQSLTPCIFKLRFNRQPSMFQPST